MSKIPKKVNCRNCNAPIDKNAAICPSCGVKNKKPFYKRTWFVIVILIVAVGLISSIGKNVGSKKDKKTEYQWPTSELVRLIPQPESKYGKIDSENEDYFSATIYDMTNEQFEDYIEECKKSGFTEDYYKNEGYYRAENAEGFTLGLWYDEKEEEMSITLSSPAEESTESEEETKDQETEMTESAETDNNEEEPAPIEETNLIDGMRPEFKEAMDSYEAFYNEYCDLLKKYSENPTDVTLIAEYTDMLKKVADMDEKFAEWESNDLNSAELKYYAEVNGRIAQKLVEVAE